jgi:signal transduction histidine kinase
MLPALRVAWITTPAWRRIALTFAGATLVLMLCAVSAALLLHEGERQYDAVAHSASVQVASEQLRNALSAAGRNVQVQLSQGADLPTAITRTRSAVQATWSELRQLSQDNPLQVQRLDGLRPLMDRRFDELLLLFDDSGQRSVDALGNGLALTQRVRTAAEIDAVLATFTAEELRVGSQREQAYEATMRWQGALVIFSVLLALAMILAALRDSLRQLARLRETQADLQTLNMALDSRVAARTEELQARNRSLDAAQARLTALSRQLLRVAEEEKRALARELHDDLGQRLAALKMNLQMASRARFVAPMPELIDDSVHLVEGCIDQVRQRAISLRPALLDEGGLGEALRWHAEQQMQRSGVRIGVHVDPEACAAGSEWSSAVFRIVQEALRNALVHAKPNQVDISLRTDAGDVVLRVRDDGRGLSGTPDPFSMGLLTMRERSELSGGQFTLQAVQPHGLEIVCRWPDAAQQRAAA